MPNNPYNNFFLSNEVEDQFNSHLDLMRFCTVDNELTGTAGMKRKINVYSASGNAQKLAKGEGNTESITAGHVQKEYTIALAQSRFEYYDEEAMEDPMVVLTGVQYAGTDMYNTVNGDVYGEYKKATRIVPVAALNFDAFVDAISMMNLEEDEKYEKFAFVSPLDLARLRKALGADLKYVEAFARTGYIGTVAGVNIYTKKDADQGSVIVGVKKAVTAFNKKGTEVEAVTEGSRSESAANVRKNTVFTRKYYIVALTDERYAIVIAFGKTATATTDTTVTSGKTYYKQDGAGYVKVTPASGANPQTLGYFEIA